MPVYHFVFHAYGSWNADHPRGYVRRGEPGIFASNTALGRYRRVLTHHQPYEFTELLQADLLLAGKEICGLNNWRLHAIGTDASHLHAVVSWSTNWEVAKVVAILKRKMSLRLGDRDGQTGRPRFSRGYSATRVRSADHLRQLLDSYLVSHHALFWREGMASPLRMPQPRHRT